VTWQGLRPGDPVLIADTRMRGATWTFRAHVRNDRTGAEWVEVVGGRAGDRTVRSFDTARVYAVTARSGRAGAAPAGELPLADAPQLPFG
jgi:hypothetical protein